AIEIRRDLGREPGPARDGPDAGHGIAVADAEGPRHRRRGDHADGYRLAVQEAAIVRHRLDRMPDCVPEVEGGTQAGDLAFVAGHHGRLLPAGGRDHSYQEVAIEPQQVVQTGLDVGEQIRVADDAVLDDLRETGDELATRQRRQRIDVGEDEARLVERADQVLASRVVDARLAADSGIYLRQQRGGEVDNRQATQQRGRGEAAEVTDDAAAERDQRRPALDPRFEQPIPGGAQGRQALVLLPVVDLDDERIEAGRPQRVLNRPAVQRANALAGQQTAATCVPERRQSRPDAGEDA